MVARVSRSQRTPPSMSMTARFCLRTMYRPPACRAPSAGGRGDPPPCGPAGSGGCGDSRKNASTGTSRTCASANSVDTEGRDWPRSIWLIRLGVTPTPRASSATRIPRRVRCAASRLPIPPTRSSGLVVLLGSDMALDTTLRSSATVLLALLSFGTARITSRLSILNVVIEPNRTARPATPRNARRSGRARRRAARAITVAGVRGRRARRGKRVRAAGTDPREGADEGSVRRLELGLEGGHQLGLGAAVAAVPGAAGHVQARSRRPAPVLRREHALRLVDLHAGMEPAQAGPAVRCAVRGPGADRLRAG